MHDDVSPDLCGGSIVKLDKQVSAEQLTTLFNTGNLKTDDELIAFLNTKLHAITQLSTSDKKHSEPRSFDLKASPFFAKLQGDT
jgi:hypothetical protein